jgi:hypothetical protein
MLIVIRSVISPYCHQGYFFPILIYKNFVDKKSLIVKKNKIKNYIYISIYIYIYIQDIKLKHT